MHPSYATIILFAYIVYAETQERMQAKLKASGDIYFIKNTPFWARVFVYVANSGIAIYNAMTVPLTILVGMLAILVLSTNIVLTYGKVVIDKKFVHISHTKLKHDQFKVLSMDKINEKVGLVKFETLIRNRAIKREMYLQTAQFDELKSAVKQIYGSPAKSDSKGKKGKK